MKRLHVLPLLLLLGTTLPLQTAHAKGGHDSHENHGVDDSKGKAPTDNRKGKEQGKPVSLRLTLKPASNAATDVAAARGRLDYKSKADKVDFKGSVWVVVPSPTLGIADAAALSTASVSLEFVREGTVYATCSLRAPTDVSTEAGTTRAHFQVQGNNASKKKGVKFQKGSCANGLPSVKKGDVVKGFATVAGVRVDIVSN